MDSLRSQERPEIAVVSVGHFNEAYPNTYFKCRMLLDSFKGSALPIIFNLSESTSTSGLQNLRSAVMARFICNNIRAWLEIIRKKPRQIYIGYPGTMLAYLCKYIPRRHRPVIVLDAFISIYDTIVVDRKILSKKSLVAKLLFRVEKSAYLSCEIVIVDTSANANYMASFFQIPEEKLCVVNLTIPAPIKMSGGCGGKKFICLFIGTFVPLQGIECIARAASLLSHRSDIHFRIIGSGQDSELLAAAMTRNDAKNITWLREWMSNDQLGQEIAGADVCLGIFGTTDKADRVWPFKNYLYMAAGKPLITGDSTHARELKQLTETDDFMTSPLGCGRALADSITTLVASPQLRTELGRNAKSFYEVHLSHKVALQELERLLTASGSSH